MDAGELPAIKKYFVDRGLRVRHAVASIPSVTIANLTSLATGKFPGHTNINGVNWFDRDSLIWRNYATLAQKNTVDSDFVVPEVYEYFPDRLTFSLFFQPHRGATKFYEDRVSAGPPYALGYYEYVDRLTLWRLHDAMKIARDYHQFPAVTWCYLLATDFRAYHSGITTEAYRNALRHNDYQIGRVLGDLQRAGLLDKVNIALTSDHGMANVTRHFKLGAFLRQAGMDLNKRQFGDSVPFDAVSRSMTNTRQCFAARATAIGGFTCESPSRPAASRTASPTGWYTPTSTTSTTTRRKKACWTW